MLSYEPETVEQMRARLCRAFEGEPYDNEATRDGAIRPGEQRKHVFDFTGGIRLIVSIDVLENHPVLHLSASLQEGTMLYQKAVEKRLNHELFCDAVMLAWWEISHGNGEAGAHALRVLGVSEKGVPHWVSLTPWRGQEQPI